MLRRRTIILVSLWLAGLAASFALDGAVARWLFGRSLHLWRYTAWAHAMKLFGDFRAIVLLVVVLMLLARLPWRRAGVVLICSGLSISAEAVKFIFGRARPLAEGNLLGPTYDFIPLSTRHAGMSFPSGHAMLAFATAVCIARYYPRWKALAYSVAAVVAVERVLELSHYLSDVVASCGLGVLMAAWCVGWLERLLLAGPPRPVLKEEEIAG